MLKYMAMSFASLITPAPQFSVNKICTTECNISNDLQLQSLSVYVGTRAFTFY